MKKVYVGEQQEYETIDDVVKHHKRGDLVIVLTSDISCNEIISIPKTLKSFHIYSEGNQRHSFSNHDIVFDLHGVVTTIEDCHLNKVTFIFSDNKKEDIKLSLKNIEGTILQCASESKPYQGKINIFIENSQVDYIELSSLNSYQKNSNITIKESEIRKGVNWKKLSTYS